MNFYYFIYFTFILFFTNIFIKYALPRMGDIFQDIPNERSSHNKTKLKSGGIFFVSIILTANILDIILNGPSEIAKIIFISSFLSLIGLIDDLFLISSKIRYLMHLIVSFLIIETVHPFLISDEYLIILFPMIIFGTVIINFINFIDGIDGLLIGCSIPILIFNQFNFLNIQIITSIASILVFLKWNWDPSKIFMGDCGSNFLGGLIFYLILSKGEYLIDFKTIFIIFPIFIDCTSCIIKRFLNKDNIFIAHKKHLYQRLYQKGISHGNISLIYILVCFINFFIAFQNNITIFIFTSLIEILFFTYLDKSLAKKFN